MPEHIIGLDHVVVVARDLERAARDWRALGFTLSPRGTHSAHLGTGNYTIMFGDDYVELLGVLSPTPHNAPTRDWLARREGIERAAFTTTDADAGAAELRARGIAATDPMDFGRPVELPDGTSTQARFRTFNWPLDERPAGLRLFACQHLTRSAVWIPELQRHANTAIGIARVELLSRDPERAAREMARLTDRPATRRDDGAWEVPSGSGRGDFVFVDREGLARRYPGVDTDGLGDEGVAALVLRVRDAGLAARAQRDGRFPRTAPRGWCWCSSRRDRHGPAMSIRLGLDRLLVAVMRRALRVVVRFRVMPEKPDALGIDRSRPVCYAMHVRQLSAFLVLDDAARQAGLPLPSAPLSGEGIAERSSFFFLTRSGQPSPLRRNPYRYSKRLERLVAAVRREPALDVQIVPVSVFWGRAPSRDDSLITALFADSWETPGMIGQFVRLLIHGRHTLVSFGEPFSLREELAQAPAPPVGAPAPGSDPATRRVARLLRAKFRRDRELAVGPNLSHRQTLVNSVVESEPVQRAIGEEAARLGSDPARAELRARRFAYEIASDYSYPFVRAYERLLDRFWTRVYDGIDVHHFEDIAQVGAGAEIVYLPCHRSHVDYLVLSYVIHQRGLAPPHVAAGINLNMAVVGSLLRRGGAFFLRRSFKGEPLFGAVFREYLHAIIQRGFPIEYFVEGGRSRTGRMLAPRTGILAMTVESYLRDPSRPVVFVPVWIGYEQLVEAESYAAELSGAAKPRETLRGLVRALRDLRSRRFGRLHLNVGEPVQLGAFLDARWPRWREEGAAPHPDAEECRHRCVAALAREVLVRINDALVVNPVTLLACAIAGVPRLAIDEAELERRIALLRALLVAQPVSDRQVLTGMDAASVIGHAQRLGIVERIEDPYGPIVSVPAQQARQLGYFANNAVHALALASLIACIVLRRPGIDRATLGRIAAGMHPFLSAELFLGWTEQDLDARIDALMGEFERAGLAVDSGGAWHPPAPGRQEAAMLEGLARIVSPTIERYLLVVEVLSHAGSGALGAADLLQQCERLARRLSLIQEGTGPDFADRGSFATIVQTLRDIGVASVEGDRLVFGAELEEAGRQADGLLPESLVLTIASAARLAPAGA